MDKFYSSFHQLPSTLLLRNGNDLLDFDKIRELKLARWRQRNEFLEMSQNSFAASNGIGLRHLQNFLDLQDAVIVKILLQRLAGAAEKGEQFQISGLIQAILTESPNLIEFFFVNSTEISIEIMAILIPNCPILFNLIGFYKSFTTFSDYSSNFLYYWKVIMILASVYPTQSTLDLCREVIRESKARNDQSNSTFAVFNGIFSVFPFLRGKNNPRPTRNKKNKNKNKKMKT